MPIISEAAKLSMRYTDHCIRATTVTMLRAANIAPNDIIAVTGHRNVQSLTHYDQGPGSETRSIMSNTLANGVNESALVPKIQGNAPLVGLPHCALVTAPNRPLFERQDRCSLFSVLCYFRYFVRE